MNTICDSCNKPLLTNGSCASVFCPLAREQREARRAKDWILGSLFGECPEERYLLAWGEGYTGDITKAERYTKAEAMEQEEEAAAYAIYVGPA
jgi:hypothetical protein